MLLCITMMMTMIMTGCSWLSPYKLDIRQGNYETIEAVSKVQVGMTKEQVRQHLGTPLLTDVFHQNRWDYVYRFYPRNHPSKPDVRHTVSVFFDDQNRVSAIEIPQELPKIPEPVIVTLEPKKTEKQPDGTEKAAEKAVSSDGATMNPPTKTD